MEDEEEYSSKDLDHLGLVAGMCRDLGLAKIIDRLSPPDPRMVITLGECVELMVINGLGFTSRPQYLEAQFFSSKPISRLIGRSIDAEHITDDRLGRGLDKLYELGCEQVFAEVTSRAVTRYNVNTSFRHLDTTSISVHGEYEDGMGLIEFGYSKDGRSDLKQFMISLMSSSDGDVPLLAKTIGGNSSDKKHFKEALSALQKEVKGSHQPSYYVADSALYTKESLTALDNTLWITRVPGQIKAVKEAYSACNKEMMRDGGNGYWYTELGCNYGGIAQRWLVVHSDKALNRDLKTLERRIIKEEEKAKKDWKKLRAAEFSCREDAKQAAHQGCKQKYHHLCNIEITEEKRTGKRGRPTERQKYQVCYKVKATLERNQAKIDQAKKLLGMFVLATNELDDKRLSNADLLNHYKDQQSVERGFRFLKDPFFLCSSIFLKKEKRIVALSMVMCLCLLIYMLTQRLIRKKLKNHEQTLPNQVGKQTARPTIRWIYQVFEGVHVIYHKTAGKLKTILTNMRDFHFQVIDILGGVFKNIYSEP